MFKLIDKIESNEIGKPYSDDAFLVMPSLAAVCDGGTSKSDHRVLNEYGSDAMWLSNVFLKNLKTAEESRTDNDWKKLLRRAAELTIRDFEMTGADKTGLEKYELPNSTLVMAMRHIDNPEKITLVNIADGVIIYRENNEIKLLSGSPVLKAIEKKREEKLVNALQAGQPLSRESFIPAMREDINAINTPKGFASVDLSLDWIEHPDIRVCETVQKNNDAFLLATDGMTRIFDLYKKYDYKTFYNKSLSEGLSNILKEIRKIETKDKERIKYPRLKTSDDICAIICI